MTSTDRYDELCEIAGSVSRETFERLEHFEREFVRWNARINLAAPSTIDALWTRHILDSAQLARLKPDALTWLDLGSGGGFPGAIMAILLRDRPGGAIELVESNNKKAAFLRTVLSEVEAPAQVHVSRIEAAVKRVAQPEIVTARALAALPLLLELSSPWLERGAMAMFHKGREYASEVSESLNDWRFDLVEHVSKIDPASRILEIAQLDRTTELPRHAARPDR